MNTIFRVSVFVLIFSIAAFISGFSADSEDSFEDLDNKITISMDFKDASLKDILKVFSMQSGLNFLASESVQDRKVTLFMDKVPLELSMDKLFKANNLSYDLDREAKIFIVKDLGKPEPEMVTKVFYLKYASVSSSSLLEEIGSQVSTAKESTSASGTSSSGSTTSTSEGRWKVADESGITSVVRKLLSKDGMVMEDYRTNSLIVMDAPTKMEIIGKTIAAIDVPVPQVMLEVEMLDVSKNLVDKLGFKYGQTPFTMSLLGATRFTKFPFGGLIPSGDTSKITGTNIPGHITAGSVVINSAGYTVMLDFLKTQTDTKYLARPRILTLNNETAEIKITTNETVGITSTSTTGDNPVTTTSPERTETGVHLRVTPQINLETGEVTMFIVPTVKDTATSTFLVAGSSSIYFKDPEERSTKSVIRVKDGETVILGGLIRNDNTTVVTKVPILGDIPVLGSLFRHKNKEKDRERELLVFITPRIIKDGNIRLAQAKKVSIVEREQSPVSAIDRFTSIDSSLDDFEMSTRP